MIRAPSSNPVGGAIRDEGKRGARERTPRARRWRTGLILGGILLAGLLLRLAYLSDLRQAPDFEHPIKDAGFHDYWARALATGDWTPPASHEDPRLGEVPFLRPPGYPYFLALIYKTFGLSYFFPRLAQILLGLLNCFLAFLLGRALFGRAVGLIASAFAAGYWVLIFFEGELEAPTLIVTLALLLVWLAYRWWTRPSRGRAILSGLTLGLLSLTLPNALAFIPVLALWMLWAGRDLVRPRQIYGHLAIFLLGVVLGIAPATIRNAVVAGDFVPIASNGAVNLYIGNNETSDGTTATIPNMQELTGLNRWNWFLYDRIARGVSREAGRPLKYSGVSAYFNRKALDYIASHPARFVELCLKRAALFWGPAEIANNKALGLEKTKYPILRWSPGFPFVLSLSLLGLLLVALERRGSRGLGAKRSAETVRAFPLLVLIIFLVLILFLSFLPFLAAGRFRVPVLPFLFLFAAYALHRLWQLLRSRSWGRAGAVLGSGVALYLLCNVQIVPYQSNPAWWFVDQASGLEVSGDLQGALQACRDALEEDPGYVDARVKLASLLARLGRPEEAIREYEEILRHRPDYVDVRVRRASLLIDRGQAARATPELEEIAAAHPEMSAAHLQLGCAFTRLRRYEEAERELRRAIELEPRDAVEHSYLAMVLAARGAHEEAIAHGRAALGLKPGVKEVHFNLGTSLRALGRQEEAAAEYREALHIDPNYVAAQRELNALSNAGTQPAPGR
ncbi:MAG: tetratricopeptide repeat protein [Candidatus Eisenbacteria bacterium]|nr:tetratricopeptide repeat protein [Candidatus Eisenbacteria bacterium]